MTAPTKPAKVEVTTADRDVVMRIFRDTARGHRALVWQRSGAVDGSLLAAGPQDAAVEVARHRVAAVEAKCERIEAACAAMAVGIHCNEHPNPLPLKLGAMVPLRVVFDIIRADAADEVSK